MNPKPSVLIAPVIVPKASDILATRLRELIVKGQITPGSFLPTERDLITIVVSFAAGSGSDTAARILGQYLSTRLGQNIVVENRIGATGAIAAAGVSKAAPDGYTLLLGTNSTHGSNSALYRKLAYDPIKDFAPIAHTGVFSYFLVVDPRLPVKSVADLVAMAVVHGLSCFCFINWFTTPSA